MKAQIVNEITFYVSNQAGQLARATRALSDASISINGLLVNEGFGKSVVRVVVEKEKEKQALEVLKGMGLDDITLDPILEVWMPSRKGILAEISERLGKVGINMENIYVTESTAKETLGYISVADPEEALKVLEQD
ncbi:MAG: ACT domain-containing protein [Candidatus Gracilibacteria bacterium]|nr:ACT domain-containing protein [Candidatus Gracilibacteria bacterium]